MLCVKPKYTTHRGMTQLQHCIVYHTFKVQYTVHVVAVINNVHIKKINYYEEVWIRNKLVHFPHSITSYLQIYF